ncbi:hypothetical protein [Novosphingobium sp. HII-3]|uniref:hypothetical protein n=1 Tax=Novosphingobium sp. HII-3 TaxID=2075565 RepID=UPI0018ECD542|nr:hypothetical protein [Novosphingobium sp. HII-3]
MARTSANPVRTGAWGWEVANGDATICDAVRSALTTNTVLEAEADIQHATKFSAKSGASRAAIIVFNSGKMHVEGAESPLKTWLSEVKDSIQAGAAAPGILLPAEIEKFPQTLRERIPECDDVVLWFFQESLRCYKAGSTAAAAFMLGAASEKAILLLIDGYSESIKDDAKKASFQTRANQRMISKKYDEFKASYRSAKTKPADGLAQDLDQLLDGAFNFYRHTRNAVGHPQIIPDLDQGVVLANMGQFITYMERIYGLLRFFKENGVEV